MVAGYHLDELGWSQFERLCQALLKAEYGAAVEAWGGSKDEGRDAFADGPLAYPEHGSRTDGPFLFQVKYVEHANSAGARPARALNDALRKERDRIARRLAAGTWTHPSVYTLLTNAPLTPALRRDVQGVIAEALPLTRVVSIDGSDVAALLDNHPEIRASYPELLSLRDLRHLIAGALNNDADRPGDISNASIDSRLAPFEVLPESGDEIARVDLLKNAIAALTATRTGEAQADAQYCSLIGPAGFGKTTLAQMVCHHATIAGAFTDGILWATVGRDCDSEAVIAVLLEAQLGHPSTFLSLEQGRQRLARSLRGKRCLIVLDDVWSESELSLLAGVAHPCAILVTSRQQHLRRRGASIAVDEMTPAESMALLLRVLGGTALDESALRTLGSRLGHWPLLLRLAGGALAESLGNGVMPEDAVRELYGELASAGVTAFDRTDGSSRELAIEATMQYSLGVLTPEMKHRWLSLGIMSYRPQPDFATVARYWEATPNDAKRSARRLARMSLLYVDERHGTIRLHDLIREYALEKIDDTEELHRKLTKSFGDLYSLVDGYALRNVAFHLRESRQYDALYTLISDRWRAHALQQTGSDRQFYHDLRLALGCAELNDSHLAELVRLSLAYSVLQSTASLIPAEALEVLTALGREREALALASLLNPSYNQFRAYLGVAQFAGDVGILQEAILSATAIALDLRFPQGLVRARPLSELATWHLKRGRADRARPLVAYARAELSSSMPAWERSGALLHIADSLTAMGSHDEALSTVLDAWGMLRSEADIESRDKALEKVALAFCQIRAWKEIDVVISEIDTNLRLFGTTVRIAAQCARNGELGRASDYVSRALSSAPSEVMLGEALLYQELRAELAIALAQLGRIDEATHLSLGNGYGNKICCALAEVHARRADFDLAVESALSAGIGQYTGRARALAAIAAAALAQGQRQRAEQLVDQIYEDSTDELLRCKASAIVAAVRTLAMTSQEDAAMELVDNSYPDDRVESRDKAFAAISGVLASDGDVDGAKRVAGRISNDLIALRAYTGMLAILAADQPDLQATIERLCRKLVLNSEQVSSERVSDTLADVVAVAAAAGELGLCQIALEGIEFPAAASEALVHIATAILRQGDVGTAGAIFYRAVGDAFTPRDDFAGECRRCRMLGRLSESLARLGDTSRARPLLEEAARALTPLESGAKDVSLMDWSLLVFAKGSVATATAALDGVDKGLAVLAGDTLPAGVFGRIAAYAKDYGDFVRVLRAARGDLGDVLDVLGETSSLTAYALGHRGRWKMLVGHESPLALPSGDA